MRDLDQLVCIRHRPLAIAQIRGSNRHPNICGMVRFYQIGRSVLVAAHISGLPEPEGPDPSAAETPVPETSSAPAPLAASGLASAPDSIVVLTAEGAVTMDMQE